MTIFRSLDHIFKLFVTAVYSSMVVGRRHWRDMVWGLLTLAGIILAMVSLVSFFNLQASSIRLVRWFIWGTDLSSNFRLQYLLILSALSILFLLGRKFNQALLVGAFALLNLALVVPLYATPSPPIAGQSFRALMLNSGQSNDSENVMVTDYIRNANPDIVLMLEVDKDSQAAFQPLHDIYPYHTYHTGKESYDGALLFSKFPFVDENVGTEMDNTQSSLVTQVMLGGQTLTLLGTQTRAPLRPGTSENRRTQLAQLAQFIAGQPGPVMLLGDLNTSLWAPSFQEFLQASGLHDGRLGFGLQTSWPTFMPALLTVPIDHVLASTDVTIHSFEKGPDVGSDHYPILVDFSLNSVEDALIRK